MANNCLVTKLKASIDNTELLKLGEVRVHIKTKSDGIIYVYGAEDVTYDHIQQYDPAPTYFIHTSNGEGDLSIFGKYDLYTFYDITGSAYELFDLDSFKGIESCINLERFGSKNQTTGAINQCFIGNIKKLQEFKNAKVLDVCSTVSQDLYGDFNGLIELKNLTNFAITGSRKVTGDTQWIKQLPYIKQVCCDGTGVVINMEDFYDVLTITEIDASYMENYVFGNVEDLASNQVLNGRTSGTILIIAWGGHSHLLCNGDSNWNRKTITFDASLPNGYSIS